MSSFKSKWPKRWLAARRARPPVRVPATEPITFNHFLPSSPSHHFHCIGRASKPAMPPKSPQQQAQPTISSFFAKRPAAAQGSAPPVASSSSPPAPSALGRRQTNGGRHDGDDADDEPPIKRVRASGPAKDASKASVVSSKDRVEQWRFTPRPKQAPDEAAGSTTDHEEIPLPSSSQRSAQEEERHNVFRKKLLGAANPISKWDQAAKAAERREAESGGNQDEEGASDAEDVNDDDEDAQSSSANLQRFASSSSSAAAGPSRPKAKGKAAQASSSKVKYTPLELQVIDLKAKHPDVLLLFEVGYKFIAYEEDAVNAAKELNVMCFPKQNMRIASIPVHRLHIHARRLIKAGYKVGVVRQTETRALKAASSNSSKPFTRSLTELYTASTWVEDLETVGGGDEAGIENPVAQNSLVALVEKLEGSDERVSIGLIAVQAATGAVIYDQFMDSSMRSELETRLAHLQPAELLLPPLGKLSKSTEKLIRYLAGNPSSSSSVGIASTRLRIERTEAVLSYNEAFGKVTDFYEEVGKAEAQDVDMADGEATGDKGKEPAVFDDAQAGATIATVMKLPHLTVIALAACIDHLKSFGLASMFQVTGNFSSFQARSEMLLSTGTLHNLELFTTTEGTYRGSLCWLLDKCKTIFGKRTLRRWIARPLTDIKRLDERMDAVSELLEGKSMLLSKVPELLTKQPDLEKGLARMLYGRATTNEVATILLALNRITHQFDETSPEAVGLSSTLLNESIAALPKARGIVKQALADINISAARKGEKENLFQEDKYPELQDEKDQIALVEADLQEHLIDLRKTLKRPTLQYATVSNIDYLVEVRVADAKKVPSDWLRMSATKSVVRFHTPTITRLLKSRDQHKEMLAAKAKDAFKSFLDELCEHSTILRNTIAALGNLDALTSLASVAALPGYTRPRFVAGGGEGEDVMRLEGLRHPMSEALRDDYVPNDIDLGGNERGVVLTGANMGGKSSTVRAIALCVVLAQIGSYVPASSATLSIRDAVLTRMGANDELAKASGRRVSA